MKEETKMPAASALFKTVPKNRYMSFYDGDRTDLRKIASFFSFSNNDIAKIAGISKNSVRLTGARIPQALLDRFQEIANICEVVAENFNGDIEKTSLWCRIDNPMLGHVSPRDMLRFGRYKKLKRLIFDAIEGHLP